MGRLHTLYLPGDGDRFAFILDQASPAASAASHWHTFATECGAKDILITPETIEILDPFASTLDQEPEPEQPWEIRHIDLGEAPEAIQRIIGATFGTGPFAHLKEPCRDGCCCSDPEPPTDDEPATEISARVAEGIRERGGLGVVAEPTPAPGMDAVTLPDEFMPELSERERRVESILRAGMMTVTPLNADGEPTGEPITGLVSGVTLGVDSSLPPISSPGIAEDPPLPRCGAVNSAGMGCRLRRGHDFLHDFMIDISRA